MSSSHVASVGMLFASARRCFRKSSYSKRRCAALPIATGRDPQASSMGRLCSSQGLFAGPRLLALATGCNTKKNSQSWCSHSTCYFLSTILQCKSAIEISRGCGYPSSSEIRRVRQLVILNMNTCMPRYNNTSGWRGWVDILSQTVEGLSSTRSPNSGIRHLFAF